ncbi:DUF1835 domain-containing protein [Lutibacter sp. B2]|nr:DUF1835 domain-containing protein [Lutibacter sp. B2]
MGKFVHIVFGDSAAGTLKYFFENNQHECKGKIINFREDHATGPLYEIDTKKGFQKRIKWFEQMFKEVFIDDYFENIEKEFMYTYEMIKNMGQDLKIVIWYGENTADQVGLRYLSGLLRNRELYEVNVSDSYVASYNGNRYKPRAFGECAPEEIDHLILKMKKIEKEKYNHLINDWEVLRTSKENLRILKNNEIIGVDESYYDHDIVSNCTFNFTKVARIIGKTMGKSNQLVGDTYIDYRVRKLIESGKVEYQGKLETMRDFEIRVVGNLNEFFAKLFKKKCEIDEDGFYHYLLEENEKNLVVDTTHITKWNTIDLSNKLILDYDDHNLFSLSWFKEGRDLIGINQTLVDNIEYRVEVYEDENGEEIKTESIILCLDGLIDKHLEIQIKPSICIGLKNLKGF